MGNEFRMSKTIIIGVGQYGKLHNSTNLKKRLFQSAKCKKNTCDGRIRPTVRKSWFHVIHPSAVPFLQECFPILGFLSHFYLCTHSRSLNFAALKCPMTCSRGTVLTARKVGSMSSIQTQGQGFKPCRTASPCLSFLSRFYWSLSATSH